MIYLLTSILASTLVFLIFRLFGNFGVNNFKAIIVNYITAHIIGVVIAGGYSPTNVITSSWLPVAVGMGLLFISLFNIMAVTAQQNGVSVASVANKMSVVIPVTLAIVIHNESFGFMKLSGILLACIGVWLTSVKSTKQESNIKKASLVFPLLLFVGSGVLDSVLNYSIKTLLNGNEDLYSSFIFLFAGLFGSLYLIIKKQFSFTGKDILWGIILGSVNYFSIYLVLKALAHSPWESSIVFPINNMSIVAASTLASWLFFKENMSWKNWTGIVVSILSIIIITWS